MSEQVKVVIIGAGAAGLAAGCRLLEKGFKDFVILEASDRIGGRVHSIPYNNGSMDLGAEWVHGERGNVVYELASQYSLTYRTDGPFEKSIIYRSNGKAVDQELSLKLMDILDDIIDGNPEEIKAYKGSMGDYFKDRYYSLVNPLIEEGKLTHAEAEDSLLWLEYVENSIDASPSWFKTAANEATEYVKLPGCVLNTWKMGGYQTALDLINKKWPNPNKSLKVEEKVRLKKEVTKIDWSGPQVQISCADGSTLTADRVVTTVSLNVLKANASKIFKPALPEQHQKAVQGLGMGTVDKIFVEFPYRWWAPGTGGVNLIWRAEDLSSVPENKAWTTGVFGFYGSDNHPAVLCGWMVGKHAETMETVPDSEVLNECMALLRRFVGPTQEIPEPVRLQRSQWYTNPFTRGSYSCRMVESDELDVWPHHLGEPVLNSQGKPVLLFAGEATHEHYFSTVHGAIETGWREADRILSLQERDAECTVAIIGAGIAGLAAAKVLTSAGLSVKVFEAQDAPGGRIRSINTNWGVLELGAQWLHGENTQLFQLAQSQGLISKQSSEEGQGQYYQLGGKTVAEGLVSQADNVINEVLRKCEGFANTSDYPASIGEEMAKKFYALFKDGDDAVKDGLFNWHQRFQIIDNSCDDLNRLSARAWGLYEDTGKTHCINFVNGFSSLIDHLVSELPGQTVYCKTPVRRIEWAPVVHTGKTLKAKIICDHVKVWANHVIVTCSLGYLKDNKHDFFKPLLPEPLSRAIELLGFGTIGKIFLVYDQPWWKDNEEGFQFVWSQDLELSVAVPWSVGVTGFDVVKGKPILQGWVGGPAASAVESLSEEKLKEQATVLLRRFTGKLDIPVAKTVFRSSWHQNEFVKGSYCHVTSDCDAEGIHCGTLAQPVFTKIRSGSPDESPTILLAGEACHTSHYSTVHGAYESGQNQADVIIKYIRQTTLAKL